MGYVEYAPNNSGGDWWLSDDDWRALEKAGWIVAWAGLEFLYDEKGQYVRDEYGIPKLVPVGQGSSRFVSFSKPDASGEYRYLGALAKYAFKPDCEHIHEAVSEFERVTGACATDAGCPCCGVPHNFTSYDVNGRDIDSGPDVEYTASF